MKVKITINNDWGFCDETSIEMDLMVIPNIGEHIWMNSTEIADKINDKLTKENFNIVDWSYLDKNADIFTVVDIQHEYINAGQVVYIILEH